MNVQDIISQLLTRQHFVWPRQSGKTTNIILFAWNNDCDVVVLEIRYNKYYKSVAEELKKRGEIKSVPNFISVHQAKENAWKKLVVDELWWFDIKDIIDVMETNSILAYSWTMTNISKYEDIKEHSNEFNEWVSTTLNCFRFNK